MNGKRSLAPKIIYLICVILLGVCLGYLSELLEFAAHTSTFVGTNDFLQGLIRVFNHFSIWIFLATLIAHFSKSIIASAVNTFAFFAAMCIAYFIQKHLHFGYSVHTQLLMWIVIALLSTGASALIQYSKSWTRFGWFIKALPAAAIIGEVISTVKYWIDYYNPIPGGPYEPLKWVLMPDTLIQLSASLMFAIALLWILPRGKKEKLPTIVLSILISTLFVPIFMLL